MTEKKTKKLSLTNMYFSIGLIIVMGFGILFLGGYFCRGFERTICIIAGILIIISTMVFNKQFEKATFLEFLRKCENDKEISEGLDVSLEELEEIKKYYKIKKY